MRVRTNFFIVFKGQEYTIKYRLEYQREDDGQWFRYKNHNRSEVSSVLKFVAFYVKYIHQRRLSYQLLKYNFIHRISSASLIVSQFFAVSM